jgi:hypothetical protein
MLVNPSWQIEPNAWGACCCWCWACSWPPVTPKALSRSKLAVKIEFTRFALSLEREHPVEVNKVTSVE